MKESEIMNPSELYLGRVVGVGATDKGDAFAVYAVSGRSEGSRQRRLEIEDDRTVRVKSLGEPTPDQLEKNDIFFYPAIRIGFSEYAGPFAVTSNGSQTEPIVEKVNKGSYDEAGVAMRDVLEETGHEGMIGDGYNTPRVAGTSLPDHPGVRDCLGLVSDKGTRICSPERFWGYINWLPTYIGGLNEEGKYDIVVCHEHDNRMRKGIHSLDAQELADELYDWMNPDLVVSTGAAVFERNPDRWSLAVKNLHD